MQRHERVTSGPREGNREPQSRSPRRGRPSLLMCATTTPVLPATSLVKCGRSEVMINTEATRSAASACSASLRKSSPVPGRGGSEQVTCMAVGSVSKLPSGRFWSPGTRIFHQGRNSPRSRFPYASDVTVIRDHTWMMAIRCAFGRSGSSTSFLRSSGSLVSNTTGRSSSSAVAATTASMAHR